ncbi:hypothetical protein CPHO_04255 [Corynebacterium phocae]|uniref:POTRA domain-containing protein n=1 Tax=Corynebacterium phocae TaxID=161895 RepID=A0A1L7D2M3_9CORY|nr:FtsQ-type POTRA domain-containing protein [Corynebacterium phocae]APT92232.1 hypothetical protein CPHO_04255 [Corynebacterium phocae]KAA8725373.1 FtsQ-type POTRA domain-containing protein [Corynebacterium phocae]
MSFKESAVVALGVLLTLVALGGLVYAVPVFKVSEVAVEGASHLSHEAVVEATGAQMGENLVRFSASDAAAGVAQLPWVKTVTVERHFPGTVEVVLTERDAVAYTQSPEGPHLIDSDGLEFVIDVPPAEAVELRGGGPASQNWEGAIDILAALPPQLRSQAEFLETEDKFNYLFHLKDGRTVIWGAAEDNANKARAMAAALKLEGGELNVSNPELVTTR